LRINKRTIGEYTTVLILFVALVGLAPAANAQRVFDPYAEPDLGRLVFVGDSLAAGVQNGSLEASQQLHGFAAVIARQAHTDLILPLVPYPGAPNTLELVSPGFPPIIEPVPGTLVVPRLDPFAPITDLAVPLQTVADALNRVPNSDITTTDETQAATDLVLGYPCPIIVVSCTAQTQVERAVALNPTTLIVAIGSNDILAAVTSGNAATVLGDPAAFVATFAGNYTELITALSATKANLVVTTIADVTEAAYFVPISKIAKDTGLSTAAVAAALGTGESDLVTLNAIPAVESILTGATSGPLPATCTGGVPCVVTATEAAGAREIIQAMNAAIVTDATTFGAVVVDVFTLFDSLYNNGYQIGGQTLTASFLGGLFSLDGLHPTNTGYAILANQYITSINAGLHTHIELADVARVAACDPLVLSNVGRWCREPF
jgi:lysophospholipase L1-like esterase